MPCSSKRRCQAKTQNQKRVCKRCTKLNSQYCFQHQKTEIKRKVLAEFTLLESKALPINWKEQLKDWFGPPSKMYDRYIKDKKRNKTWFASLFLPSTSTTEMDLELIACTVIDFLSEKHVDIIAVGVKPQYQGKGYCSMLMKKIFSELNKIKVNEIDMTNEAVPIEAGFKCYINSAFSQGYKLECNDKEKTKFCIKMKFLQNKVNEV